MDFLRSRIQDRFFSFLQQRNKKRKISEATADLWKDLPEDILLEIFIRLPDFQSAIRTATVCRKWHSLIFSHTPLFIQKFTIFFRIADDIHLVFSPQFFQPCCKLYSDQESMYCTSPDFLDFIMPCSPMVIRGSCNDLLLVSPGSRVSTQLYICNPLTKQFIQLPDIPRLPPRDGRNYYIGFDNDVAGHALVCMPPGPSVSKFRFKVVEFHNTIYPNNNPKSIQQPYMLYCSESRKWETRRLHYPLCVSFANWLHGVACNGTLYWLELKFYGENTRVVYLDLSKDGKCGAIDFPDDYCRGQIFSRDQIGVVCVRGGEELRLLQLVLTKPKQPTVDLKVWKLMSRGNKKKWVLVHHKNELKKPNPRSFQALPFVHPTDGDLVFLVWGQQVFQYQLKDTKKTKTKEKVGKLQHSMKMSSVVDTSPLDQLLQFPVVHTFWPTQILTS